MKNWKGKNNPRWKGGIKIHDCGYRLIASPNHPSRDKQGYVREHRLVMESVLGRFLLSTEDIHHIDRNKQNNTPSNLELFSNRSDHLRARHYKDVNSGQFKKGHISYNKKGKDLKCNVCNNNFWASPSEFNRKYCSSVCYWGTKKGVEPAWLVR